ncbi:MAG: hypothetical protein P4L43_07145 [Syntrophobacteraceae bacterium]|nr:hypothetical protein [Syntrophobacteraceae bacterium]
MDFNDPARSRGLDTVKHQLEFELGLAAARAEKLKYEHELAREEHELDREWGEQEVDLDEGPEIDF